MSLAEAALGFARYIELRPERAVGYARLGRVLLQVGHLKDAETQLKKAIELDPKLIPAIMHLSYVRSACHAGLRRRKPPFFR